MLQSPTSLILASASATRLALLHAAGLRATARPARIDEAALKQSARAEGATASGTALMLATLKAIYAHAADPAGEDTLVIGADQLLTCGDAWFDKPATRAEARAHLRHLRGRTHTLHTAVTCLRGGIEVWHHSGTTSPPPASPCAASPTPFSTPTSTPRATPCCPASAPTASKAPASSSSSISTASTARSWACPCSPLLGFLRQHGILPN